MVISTVVLFSSCNNNRTENKVDANNVYNPNSATATNNKDNLPVMEFERGTKYDFGNAQTGEVLVNTFYFKNTGKSDLIISDVSTSCGCTVSSYTDKPVPPGGEGSITLTFDTKGRTGHQVKRATVLTNCQPNRVILTVTANLTKNE